MENNQIYLFGAPIRKTVFTVFIPRSKIKNSGLI